MKLTKLSNKQMRKLKIGVVGLTLVVALGVAGLSAYFTDTKSTTNTFTIGKVSQELTEPSWNKDNPPKNITPGQELEKDPQVTNTGTNDQYVFMTVAVPYANIMTVNDDGTKNASTDTPLFTYTTNEGWTQLGNSIKNEDNHTYIYTYYYGKDNTMMILTKNQTTPALFNKVRFVDAVEGQGLQDSTQNILINSYGIQTTHLENATTPDQIWQLVYDQTN